MLFNDFSNLVFSLASPVILLEGSRSVEDADKKKLTSLSAKLASAFPNAVFRSGNAAEICGRGYNNLFNCDAFRRKTNQPFNYDH